MSTLIQKKICLLGDFSVGKTSLTERFVYNRFSERYISTIGVKISRKSIVISPEVTLNILIWDLAGSEEFTGVQSSYIQGAKGAIFVCDLTRPKTLESLEKYNRQLEDATPNIPIALVGNKTDLASECKIDRYSLEKEARKFNTIAITTTSAKTGRNVESIFEALAKELV
ncbi:MAG: GTP-binding protein [Chloroflexi bacterium]|nr:GTP-binding protein [Chloroflexota bacterium]